MLIFLALGWPMARRAVLGKVMAGIILLPALAAAGMAFSKAFNPSPPDVTSLVVTAGEAVVINIAIIAMAGLTWWTASGWPDIALGLIIIGLNVQAAREVWEVATEESLAAQALAGEDIDDD